VVGPASRSLQYFTPPSAFPTLASISEELKSCFMDRIHGGRFSLITAALHVLLGPDCKARHPPTQHPPPSSVWGCLEYSVVRISRQMQINYSRDTMLQSYKCHSNFFTFLSCCLRQVRRERTQTKTDNSTVFVFAEATSTKSTEHTFL